MFCIKCGKETNGEQVFCDHCLEVMEQYPIKPGTPVQLPKRSSAASGKKTARRRISLEEQVHRLRATIRTLLICMLVLCLLLGFFVWSYFQPRGVVQDLPENNIGQNYTVEESTDKD